MSMFPSLPGWLFHDQLGKGSFGCVYVATCLKYNQKFAVKVVYSLPYDLTEARREHIMREAENMKRIEHPNAIHIYDAFWLDSDFYLIMELCPNGTLLSMVRDNGKLAHREIATYFQQILSVLAYCHERNIAHRDLKPENIFFDVYGRPKVGDWGQSYQCESLLKSRVGSHTYAAPEVLAWKEYDGKAIDMWAIGVVLYVAATGKIPWVGDSRQAREAEARAGRFTIPEYVDPDVADLITKLIVVDPTKRLTAQAALEHPLFKSPDVGLPLPPLKTKSTNAVPLSRQGHKSVSRFMLPVGPQRRRLSHNIILNMGRGGARALDADCKIETFTTPE